MLLDKSSQFMRSFKVEAVSIALARTPDLPLISQ